MVAYIINLPEHNFGQNHNHQSEYPYSMEAMHVHITMHLHVIVANKISTLIIYSVQVWMKLMIQHAINQLLCYHSECYKTAKLSCSQGVKLMVQSVSITVMLSWQH